MSAPAKRCKDCVAEGVTTDRKLATKKGSDELEPGPRCITHHRAVVKARKVAAHGNRTESTYGITAAEYWGIYAFQGGRCALCRLATGAARRLAVDHDHDLAKLHDHPVDQGCRECVRGLLCKRCNRFGVPLIWEVILRTLEYLANPPARQYLASVSQVVT